MCYNVRSLYTVCADSPGCEIIECEAYLSRTPESRLASSCTTVEVVKLVYGWCPGCEDVASRVPGFVPRDPIIIRSHWILKDVVKFNEFRANMELAAEHDVDPLELVDEPLRGFEDDRGLTWEEVTLERKLQSFHPTQIWLGTGKYEYPCNEHHMAMILRRARIWTIIWANGDERLYEEDPFVPLFWDEPDHPDVWTATRDMHGRGRDADEGTYDPPPTYRDVWEDRPPAFDNA